MTTLELLNKITCGDTRELIERIDDNSLDSIVTSPPYYKLRDYGIGKEQIGQEKSIEEYSKNLSDIFGKLLPKMKETGTMFINVGKTYVKGEDLFIPHTVATGIRSMGWKSINDLIFWKLRMPAHAPSSRFDVDYENIFFMVKDIKKHYFKEQIIKRDFVNERCKEAITEIREKAFPDP